MKTFGDNGRLTLLGLALALATGAGATEFRAGGGGARADGVVKVDSLVVEAPATWGGNGTVAGDVTVSGTVSPGWSPLGVGTQTVLGAVTFEPGSRFEVYAASHTSLDRLNATGTVDGTCSVVLTNAAGAVPVEQVIIQGDASSDYSGFAPQDAGTWRLGEQGSLDLAVTHLRGDTDSDTLPDWWELRYLFSRTAADPLGHSDDDGVPDGDEYGADTIPTNGASYFHVTGLEHTNSFAVEFVCTNSRVYSLQFATNMVDGQWSMVDGATNVPGVGSSMSLTDTVDAVQRSYRVGVSIP